MISTLARRLDRHQPPPLVVVDEAHHARASAYERVLAHAPAALVVGLTATPQRLDGRGLGAHFEGIVEGPTVASLIEDGWLADYDYYAPPVQFELAGVDRLDGDYHRGQLEARVARRRVIGDVVQHYRRLLQGRPSIGFAVSLRHCALVEALFRAEGFRAATIDGTLSWNERRRRLLALATGELNLLLSCELIGEGIDVPTCYGILDMRPTASLTVFLQHAGRGLRRKPDGGKAIIVDHVGNWERHGLPASPRQWSLADRPQKRSAAAGVRQCQTCYRIVETGRLPDCGEAECPLGRPPAGRTIEHVNGTLQRIEIGEPRLGEGTRYRRSIRPRLCPSAAARGHRPGPADADRPHSRLGAGLGAGACERQRRRRRSCSR